MSDNKSVKVEDLKDIAGGLSEKLTLLKQELLADIPAEVKEKLHGLKSDVEVCKTLAENGVDVTALEDKIKAAGFNLSKLGQELTDLEVEGVAGGFDKRGFDYDVKCKCGNNNRDDFSYQYLASLIDPVEWYRCMKCNNYVATIRNNILLHVSKEDFDEYFK